MAITVIGRWGRTAGAAAMGPLRRIFSLSFITSYAPHVGRMVKAGSTMAASIATIWWIFRGELMSAEEATAFAAKHGLDELMTKTRDPMAVISATLDKIPGITPDARAILMKGLTEGPEALAAAQGKAQQTPVSSAGASPSAQKSSAGTTLAAPTLTEAAAAGRTPDAVIEARLAQTPGALTPVRGGSAIGSEPAGQLSAATLNYALSFGTRMKREVASWGAAHGISDPTSFVEGLLSIVARYGAYLKKGD
jgi:hypothetical protein